MKRFILLFGVFVAVSLVAKVDTSAQSSNEGGAELFQENCAPCHPDGGNVYNPQKTLHKKDLDANNIKTRADIIKKMRNPGPGMMKFDSDTMSQENAKKIADYILKTFE